MKQIESTPAPGWRFRIGMGLFGLGMLCPLFVPLVAATDLPASWKGTLSGLLMLGIPELVWVAAAAIMGKQGFLLVKNRAFGFLKQLVFPDVVSRARYRMGLGMLAVPLLFGWIAPYVAHRISGYEESRVAVNAAGDLLVILSLFVLGGDFWDKLRALFVYDARASLPERSSAA